MVNNINALFIGAIDELADKLATQRFYTDFVQLGQEKGMVLDVSDTGFSEVANRSWGVPYVSFATKGDLRTPVGAIGKANQWVLEKLGGLKGDEARAFIKEAHDEYRAAETSLLDQRTTGVAVAPGGGLYVKIPDSDAYGAMKGKWVREDLARWAHVGAPGEAQLAAEKMADATAQTILGKFYRGWKGAKTVGQFSTQGGNILANAGTAEMTPIGRSAMKKYILNPFGLKKLLHYLDQHKKGNYVLPDGSMNPISKLAQHKVGAGFMEAEIGASGVGDGSEIMRIAATLTKNPRATNVVGRARNSINQGLTSVANRMKNAYTGAEVIFKAAVALETAERLGKYAELSQRMALRLELGGMPLARALDLIDDVAANGPKSPYFNDLFASFGGKERPFAVRAFRKSLGGDLAENLKQFGETPENVKRALADSRIGEPNRLKTSMDVADSQFHNYDEVSNAVRASRQNPFVGFLAWNPFITWGVKQARTMGKWVHQHPVLASTGTRITEAYLDAMAKYNGVVEADEYRSVVRQLPFVNRVATLQTGVDPTMKNAKTGGPALRGIGMERVLPTSEYIPVEYNRADDKAWLPSYMNLFQNSPAWQFVKSWEQKVTPLGGMGTEAGQLEARRAMVGLLLPYQFGIGLMDLEPAMRGEAVGRSGELRTVGQQVTRMLVPLKPQTYGMGQTFERTQAQTDMRMKNLEAYWTDKIEKAAMAGDDAEVARLVEKMKIDAGPGVAGDIEKAINTKIRLLAPGQ